MNKKYLFFIVMSLIIFGLIMRQLPHAPNMTPITAIAFVSSLYLGRIWAIFIPGVILFVSDITIGFYDWRIMASVYGSFALIGCLSFIAKKYNDATTISSTVVGSSLLFFLITNGAVWAFSPWYDKTFAGLLYAYELGLPFLRNMLTGDILYTIALICLFELTYVVIKNKKIIGVKSQAV